MTRRRVVSLDGNRVVPFLGNCVAPFQGNQVVSLNGNWVAPISGNFAPEYFPIFDKYFQLEKKHDGRIYTTGLGLTFCKMAVEAHRGKIGVQSENMKGSRFFFVLPLERKGEDLRGKP